MVCSRGGCLFISRIAIRIAGNCQMPAYAICIMQVCRQVEISEIKTVYHLCTFASSSGNH